MSTHYTAGGMPLAFKQEDFLVRSMNRERQSTRSFIRGKEFSNALLQTANVPLKYGSQ